MVALPVRGLVPILLILVSALAGCLGDDDAPAADTQTGTDSLGTGTGGNATNNLTDSKRPSVEGFVLDESRAPLVGATVVLQNEGVSATTDEKGHYSLAGLLDNQQYVLIAEMEGHKKKAQQVIAIDDKIVRLDFVLEEIADAKPYSQVIERKGLISCQVFAGFGHDHGGNGTEFEQGCGGFVAPDPNAVQILEFSVDQGVAGIVIETAWDATHPLAEFFMVTVESVGYGDLDKEFAKVIGPSILKIEIPQGDIAKYYTGQGGQIRVTVDVHFEDDDEQAAGVAFAFQEDFEVRLSAFYVEPQPRTYSAFEES